MSGPTIIYLSVIYNRISSIDKRIQHFTYLSEKDNEDRLWIMTFALDKSFETK